MTADVQFIEGMEDVLVDSLKVCTSINQTNRNTIRLLLDEVAQYPAEMWNLQERITALELQLDAARKSEPK